MFVNLQAYRRALPMHMLFGRIATADNFATDLSASYAGKLGSLDENGYPQRSGGSSTG